MAELIIGFIGQNGSGKSKAAAYLAERYKTEYKVEKLAFSTILRRFLQDLGVTTSRENLLRYSEVLRKHFGQNLLSEHVGEQIRLSRADLIIVEGIRRKSDLSNLNFHNFHLISLIAKPEIRYQRLVSRKQNPGDEQKSYEDFLTDQESEPERDIQKVAKKAKIIIDNNGTTKELQLQLELAVTNLWPPKKSKADLEKEAQEMFEALHCD